jgi:hypothetical protein
VSRQNLCPNPACGANVTGWGGGSVPTRATGIAGLPVTTGAHYSANNYAQTPTGVASPGTTYTVSMYVNNASTLPLNNKILFLSFTRSAGGDDFSQTTTVTVATGVSRISITGVAPALTTGVYLILDTFNATFGAGVDLSACLIEASGSLGTYFDGNTANASWDGTANNSTSTLADSTVTPNGLAVPITFGTATVSLGITTTPTGIAVPVALGVPTVGATVPGSGPVAEAGGSWWQLEAVARTNRENARQELLAGPLACPNDGEPLQYDPRSKRRRCSFDGWISPV